MITLLPSTKPTRVQQALMDRKFGMFIHFGINTFNDTEWSNGKLDINSYAPTAIDADSWIRHAKMAGMNYVILICKHHDGFCLWDTHTTTYSVNYSPNKTDVVMEVSKACEKYGIGLGLYYSLWDRHEACYKNDKAYLSYMCAQLRELLGGKYGKICEVWLDGGWDKRAKRWHLDVIYDLVHTLQPEAACATNVTIGYTWSKKSMTKFLPEKYREGMPIRYFPSDFRLWDPNFTREDDPKLYEYKGELYYLPFEATINTRFGHWFWHTRYVNDPLNDVDTIAEKYHLLVDHGNNLIINVPPNIHGEQEAGDIDNLMAIAKKLGIYRELE